MAHFQGTLTGRVARECVRCLAIFEEELFLYCDADFSQSTPSALSPDSPKKMKKGSRRHILPIDEAQEQDVDTYPITESQIDLFPALREYLILATPLHPLCQERCAGLCQVCGDQFKRRRMWMLLASHRFIIRGFGHSLYGE